MDVLSKQKDYLDFIDQTVPYIKKLTISLQTHLGVTNFGYLRIFRDNHYFYITDNKDLIHNYVKTIKSESLFFKQFLYIPNSVYKFILWPSEPSSTSMELYRRYNYWNGITLAKETKEYTELWWFGSAAGNTNAAKFLIKNTAQLYKYVLFFEEKTRHIIPHKSSPYIPIYTDGIDLSMIQESHSEEEHAKITRFLEDIKLVKITVPLPNYTTCISSREMDCLALMMQGLDAKSIGAKLSISPRTVEVHFSNIKNKTGVHSKSRLIDIYTTHLKKHLWHI